MKLGFSLAALDPFVSLVSETELLEKIFEMVWKYYKNMCYTLKWIVASICHIQFIEEEIVNCSIEQPMLRK